MISDQLAPALSGKGISIVGWTLDMPRSAPFNNWMATVVFRVPRNAGPRLRQMVWWESGGDLRGKVRLEHEGTVIEGLAALNGCVLNEEPLDCYLEPGMNPKDWSILYVEFAGVDPVAESLIPVPVMLEARTP